MNFDILDLSEIFCGIMVSTFGKKNEIFCCFLQFGYNYCSLKLKLIYT